MQSSKASEGELGVKKGIVFIIGTETSECLKSDRFEEFPRYPFVALLV